MLSGIIRAHSASGDFLLHQAEMGVGSGVAALPALRLPHNWGSVTADGCQTTSPDYHHQDPNISTSQNSFCLKQTAFELGLP